jgi:hypothetical protein
LCALLNSIANSKGSVQVATKKTDNKFDAIIYALQSFIGIVTARWAAEGEIPPVVQAELENISAMLYNEVSPQAKQLVADITRLNAEGQAAAASPVQ